MAVLAVMLLAACNLTGNGGAVRHGTGAAGARSATIEVGGRSLLIAGPRGYCVDAESIEVTGGNAFALLGPCPAVSRSPLAPRPEVPALLTVSVGPGPVQGVGAVAGSAQEMDRFFRSADGRAALSRNGDARSVMILDSFFNDDVYYLRARDSSAPIVPGTTPDFWRAWFDLPGQIAAVSVTGITGQPLSPDQGLELTREFVTVLRGRNGAPVPEPPAEPVAPPAPATVAAAPPAPDAVEPRDEILEPQVLPEEPPKKRKKRKKRKGLLDIGLLRRLLN